MKQKTKTEPGMGATIVRRLRDEEIDFSEMPEITDFSGAVRGPYLEAVRELRQRREAAEKPTRTAS